MIEILTALKLAGPLTRIVSSVVSGDSTHREKVAADLDAIAGCAREIATRLEQDSAGDIDELTGRLRHFVSQIRRTLHDVIVDTTASNAGLSTNDDVDSFSEQMQRVVEQLRAFDDPQGDEKSPLFRSGVRRTGTLAATAMHRVDAWRMIQRRAGELGLKVKIGCHTFRATGITAYLEAGGTLENAQAMAAHESPRTTKLYDRTGDEITLDEVERITI